jgi:hypothetical protein
VVQAEVICSEDAAVFCDARSISLAAPWTRVPAACIS